MQIETERLLLRPWNESDAESLFTCAKDPAVGSATDELVVKTERLRIFPVSDGEMRRMIGAEEDAELKAAYREMLEGSLAHPAERNWYAVWQIWDRERDTLVGDLSFKGFCGGAVELGYGILAKFQNQGYATEAVLAMSHWAARQPGVRRIEAETEPDNRASRRVLEKAGYLPAGVMGVEGPRFVFQPKQMT